MPLRAASSFFVTFLSSGCCLMSFHCGLTHFGNFSMLMPSTPGAPLLDLTFFHASAILVLDTMYSTDAKSTGGDSMTRQAPKSPHGLTSYLSSRAPPHHTAFGPFPKASPGFSSSADYCHVNAHRSQALFHHVR